MRNNLFLALEYEDLEEIKKLYEEDQHVLSELTFEGDNVLHIAAREGLSEIVNWILHTKSSLAVARNKDGNTPLHEAAKSGKADLVKILLGHKRSCAFCLNKFGETALIIACKYGKEQTVEQLLQDTTEAHRSPREATYKGNFLNLKCLVNFQIAWNRLASSLLHAAVQGGKLEVVVAILNHRVDDHVWHNDLMRVKDNFGRCAVHVAVMKGRWDIIQQFKLKRPDCVEIRSSDHKSVLHFAVEYNQLLIVQNLLAGKNELKRADLVSRDHDFLHNTALHLAAKNGVDSQLLDLLLRYAVENINALNDEDMTALDIASATAQHNPNCAIIVEKLEAAKAIRSSPVPKSHSGQGADKDTLNTHIIVASLIATVTFAAIFQIPGALEDDKGSIHYGAAKMAFRKLFKLFIFSDTAAFTTSIAVVAVWLVRQQLSDTYVKGTPMLPHLSGLCLPVSIAWTIAAFVSATIIVIIPPNYDKLKSKDKRAYTEYQLDWGTELLIAIVGPVIGSLIFCLIITYRENLFPKYFHKVVPIYVYVLLFLVTFLIIVATLGGY